MSSLSNPRLARILAHPRQPALLVLRDSDGHTVRKVIYATDSPTSRSRARNFLIDEARVLGYQVLSGKANSSS